MGNEDLANHYLTIGELSQASKAFSRMREYCTTPKHVAEMNLKLLLLSIEQGEWMQVQSNVLKVRNLQLKPEEMIDVDPKLHAATGLAQMARGNYREAATAFLMVGPALGQTFNQVISPNDVAVYGGLCALASMNRNELQTKVLGHAAFRTYLELEPHIRRAITLFCNSKYAQCLEILEAYKTDYLLDLYLQKHIPQLYYRIRSKSIVQYFIPFSCVTLDDMASVFAKSEGSIEEELVEMIERGALDAKIDTQHRVSYPDYISPSDSWSQSISAS